MTTFPFTLVMGREVFRCRYQTKYLVRVAHGPVGEILDELVPELHLLPEGQVVSPLHHRVDQLAQLRLDVKSQNSRVLKMEFCSQLELK